VDRINILGSNFCVSFFGHQNIKPFFHKNQNLLPFKPPKMPKRFKDDIQCTLHYCAYQKSHCSIDCPNKPSFIISNQDSRSILNTKEDQHQQKKLSELEVIKDWVARLPEVKPKEIPSTPRKIRTGFF
jgi:hypothetical protein